jgi:hypothetical protein
MSKLDYKKQFPQYYRPKKKPVILDIPEMNYFMIDGKGDPNTSKEYQAAVECLYAASYTLKMKIVKKNNPENDYVVPPLEGLWYMDKMEDWSMDNKEDWLWTMMIRIPDFVSEEQIRKSIELTKELKDPVALSKLYHEKYNEGSVVQIMYLGSYADEGPTIKLMHDYANDEGYRLNGKHHEIYLGDPRKTAPEKLKTVIRQPITK